MTATKADYEGAGPQMQWHRKPSSGLCTVCGVGAKMRKGVEHRALTAEESWQYKAPYVKRVSVAFGQDYDDRRVGWDGQELRPHESASTAT